MAERKTCGVCARMSKYDWDRKYCPVTAACVHRNRPADSCRLFLDKSAKSKEGSDVRKG
jgi:hypothetical protein